MIRSSRLDLAPAATNEARLRQAFFTDICPSPTNEFAGFLSLGKNP